MTKLTYGTPISVKSRYEYLTLCRAWQIQTRSSFCDYTYAGKGSYVISGYEDFRGSVAVVRRAGNL